MRRLAGLLVALIVASLPAAAAPTFPALSGRVVDAANILSPDVETALAVKLAELETRTTDQFVVVTLPSLGGYDIADYGYQLGRAWEIGQKGKNNGLLLIVAPSERAVRFEVGYGLEGTMTDALTRVIIENAILPRFRANDYPGGITRGVDDAIQVLKGDAAELQQLAEKRDADDDIWATILPFLIFFIIILAVNYLRSRGGGRRSGWGSILGGAAGSSWSSGRSSGGGWSGGGGFSGGGGSFGGGGSSGRW